jgi:heptose-I-phosphate ethanolaminephosphotransferase
LFFIDGLISLIHWILLKGPITASSIFVFLNTNFNEAGEFLSLKLNFRFLLLLPYIALFVWSLLKTPKITYYKNGKYIVIVICLISISFFVESGINNRFVRKACPQTVKAIVSFLDEAKAFKALKQRELIQISVETSYSDENKYLFVLILGESVNRNHMSLYGYYRETTPNLDKRNDIIVFNNVISPYSNTISSVLSSLTASDINNKKRFNESVSLNDVFYSAEYKTFWLSNQLPIGVWDNAVYNLAKTFDITHYTNSSANSSYESTYTSPYDEVLFEPFRKALADTAKYKFIVLHLMGSHSAYVKRYPKEYSIFSQADNVKERTINQYDNSILYNDFFVDSLLKVLVNYSNTDTNIIASAIYLSDHGENVYDEGNTAGHDYTGVLPDANIEIPFIVWLSQSYIDNYQHKASIIKQNSSCPFMIDNLFESVIDLEFIDYKEINLRKSIFNENYNLNRKRVLEDKSNYDIRSY